MRWPGRRQDTEDAPGPGAGAPRPLRGVRFDLGDQAGRLRQLAPLVKGFRAPEGFHLWNGAYESVDAEVLWAMVRGLAPKRMLLAGAPEHAETLVRAAAEDEPATAAEPEDLEPRDLVLAGQPTPQLLLEVMPRLAPGVVVHLHGVALPGPQDDLLHAFLVGNRDVEVLLALGALADEHPAIVKHTVPSWRGESRPSAFWLRRA